MNRTPTAALLIAVAVDRVHAGRWFTVLGGSSAALVLANVVGYVVFSLWLVVFAGSLVPRPDGATGSRRPALATAGR